MTLDLADLKIRARLLGTTPEVIIDIRYPNTPEYRERVNRALADILSPREPLAPKRGVTHQAVYCTDAEMAQIAAFLKWQREEAAQKKKPPKPS